MAHPHHLPPGMEDAIMMKALVLHTGLDLTNIVTSAHRRHFAEPDISFTLDDVLARIKRCQYSMVVIEVASLWRGADEPLVTLRQSTELPILALVRGQDRDVFMECLKVADDCVMEPFETHEIIARAIALAEHKPCACKMSAATKVEITDKSIYNRGLRIIPKSEEVYVNHQKASLTPKEYVVLYYMAMNPNRLLSKEDIFAFGWPNEYEFDVKKAVSRQVLSVRKKLFQLSDEVFIETVWGKGFLFHEHKEGYIQLVL